MYNAKNTAVSNQSYAILNAIRNESDIFRTSTPIVQNADDAKAFGEFVTGAGSYKELFWGILINRIAETLITGREFKNKLAMFRRGKIGLGDIVQNIWVGLVKPEGWTSDVANPGDVYKTNKPEAKVSMSAVNCKLTYEVTTNDIELGYAFVQENGLYSLVSKIVERLITSEQIDDYLMMKWVIVKNLLANPKAIVSIGEITDNASADDAVRAMKKVVNDYPFPKTEYNEAGVPAPCPTGDILFITTSKSRADLDVLSLAKAFNITYDQFLGQEVQIDEFGFDAFSLDRLYALLDEQVELGLIPAYEKFTEENLADLAAMETAIIDKDWFMSFDKVYEMNSIYDPKHLNNNTFLTIHRIYSYNPFANITYFTSKAAPTITVTPATLSVAVGATGTVKGTGSAGTTVSYASADESIATVDASGKVTGVKAGTTIVTATASNLGGAASKGVTVTVTA